MKQRPNRPRWLHRRLQHDWFFVSLCETLNGVTDELEHVAASVYRKPLR